MILEGEGDQIFGQGAAAVAVAAAAAVASAAPVAAVGAARVS